MYLENGNEVVLRIPQSSSISVATPSDCLVSYAGHSFEGMGGITPMQRSSWCILQPQPTEQCSSMEPWTLAIPFTSVSVSNMLLWTLAIPFTPVSV